jgi:hypothetical protein
MPGYLGGGSCRLSSSVDQWLRCLPQNIAHHHRIAGLLDISGNGAAYGAQTDKAYHFHFSTSWIG